MNSKKKLYCYVDETGQDTGSTIFIVVAVIVVLDVYKWAGCIRMAQSGNEQCKVLVNKAKKQGLLKEA